MVIWSMWVVRSTELIPIAGCVRIREPKGQSSSGANVWSLSRRSTPGIDFDLKRHADINHLALADGKLRRRSALDDDHARGDPAQGRIGFDGRLDAQIPAGGHVGLHRGEGGT